jgi:hypothetical protein
MGAPAQLDKADAVSTATNYVASLLNAAASLALALLVPTFVGLARDMAAEHAPGLTAVAGGLLESFFSLRFGIFFLVFFSCFYLARQSSKPALRILLFWIPASVATALGFCLWAYLVSLMRMMQRA